MDRFTIPQLEQRIIALGEINKTDGHKDTYEGLAAVKAMAGKTGF